MNSRIAQVVVSVQMQMARGNAARSEGYLKYQKIVVDCTSTQERSNSLIYGHFANLSTAKALHCA
jgi:hypothetical protein